MNGKSRLFAGLLCAVLISLLTVPASAHCGRGRGHHSGYTQSVQASAAVCPYEDCTTAGCHLHDGVTYCGYGHGSASCGDSCAVAASYCHGGHHHGGC